MADTLPSDVRITTKQETAELLDSNGQTLTRSSPLSSLFDKMEQGVPAAEAAKQVETEKPSPKPDVKPEVKPEVNPEVKPTTTNLPDLSSKLDSTVQKKSEDEEISRAKLKAQSTPKDSEDVKAPAEEVVPEDELQVLPHDKPKTAKRIQALLKKIETVNSTYAETKKQAEERATKLAELEKRLAEVKTVDPKVDEAVKKQLEELSMFRRRYDLDNDPEVKSKYDDRIVSSEKPIADILVKNGAGEALVAIIKEEGGWLKFSQSGRMITLKDGPLPAAEVADLIVKNLPFADRKLIDSISMEQITTKREKERFFEEQTKTANEFFKKQEEEKAKGTQDYQKQVEEARKAIDAWDKDVHEKNEWLKEKEIPTNATPEQKLELEEDNRYTKQLNGLLKKAVETKDINGMLEVVLDSVKYCQERRAHSKTQQALAVEKKNVQKLQAEIDKFKQGARSVSKAGSISGSGTSSGEAQTAKPETFKEALDRIAAGEQIE
jgi:hypothetical protein